MLGTAAVLPKPLLLQTPLDKGASSCIFQDDQCSQAPCRHNDCIGLDAETDWASVSKSGVIGRALGKLGIIDNLTYNLLLRPGGLKSLDVSAPLEKEAGWGQSEAAQGHGASLLHRAGGSTSTWRRL